MTCQHPNTHETLNSYVCEDCGLELTVEIQDRLEELRQALRNENISYGELSELQSLAPYISPDDTELLEAAGVPENN